MNMTPNSHGHSSLFSRIKLFDGHHAASEGLIALVTSSPQRVRQISAMLKETAYSSHRVVWLPCDTFLQHSANNASFDAVLMDVENHDEHVASSEVKHWLQHTGDARVIIIGGKDTNRFHFSTLFKWPAGLITEEQLGAARLEKELRHAKIAAVAPHATTATPRLSLA